jgi:hypothetical protein
MCQQPLTEMMKSRCKNERGKQWNSDLRTGAISSCIRLFIIPLRFDKLVDDGLHENSLSHHG